MAGEDARIERLAGHADVVGAFYDSNPYPTPVSSLDGYREVHRSPDRRRALSLLLWPTEEPRPHREILVAGCGTSQAAKYAVREPGARVTAIDISEISLRYTRDLKEKYDLRNLELRRLAIERAGELGLTFDQIVCTGVLHHLPDPDIGLRALRSVLAPNGAMHLMVYATYGRAGIYMVQEYCRLIGVGASGAELRELGAVVDSLSPEHPIAAVAKRGKEFKDPAVLADALLHPQDRSYTVPEVYSWLQRCGMLFGRWYEQAPYLPQCGALARMPHAGRLCSLNAPLQHAAAELLRGTMTKHGFIAYRDDRPGTSPPIALNGDTCQTYVPLRLPWTLCIRDRVPPGSIAVLINPAHTYPDLALPISAMQERILVAIDGERTIGEILEDSGAGGDERARRFIERLWEYDQIVFDARPAKGR